MNAINNECDGCNAEAGEPCREWCISQLLPVEST
jgi:hypothetical protein